MVDAHYEAYVPDDAQGGAVVNDYYEYDTLIKEGAAEAAVDAGQDNYYGVHADAGGAADVGSGTIVMPGDGHEGSGAAETIQHIVDEAKERVERVVENIQEAATTSSSAADPVPGEGIASTSTMEVSTLATRLDMAKKMSAAALNPYVLILVAYLGAVAAQLVCVTRSALEHKVRLNLQRSRVRGHAILAAVNLLSTWTFMFKHLTWSYGNFLETARIAGEELTTVPSCYFDRSAACFAAQTTAQLLRVGSWLQRTQLFKEAWLMVIVGQLNWWWSAEVCLFTVGFWALYVRIQGARYSVPHTWAYMLLGQTCAISVAAGIFAIAIESRKYASVQHDGGTLSGIPFPSATAGTHRRKTSDASQAMPPPTSPARRRAAKGGDATLQPSTPSLLLMLIAFAAGAAIIYLKPATLQTVLIMHAAPMLIAMPVLSDLIPRQKTSSLLAKVLNTTALYGVVAAVSLAIRLRLHHDIYTNGFTVFDLKDVALSTAAQASISADSIGVTLLTLTSLTSQAFAAYKGRQGSVQVALFILLILLTPLLGPSVVMPTAMAIEEHRIQSSATTSSRASTAAAGRTSSTSSKASPRSSLSSSFATPMKERLSELISRRPSSSSSAQKKTSSATPRQRKASTSSVVDSTADSGNESSSVKKKTPSRKSAASSDSTPVPAKKPRGRAKKTVEEPAAADASATEGDESTTSKASTTRKRSAATTSKRGRAAPKKTTTTSRVRKAAADTVEDDDEGDMTSAASGTDVDGPANRTRRSTTATTRGRGRGGRRKAAAA